MLNHCPVIPKNNIPSPTMHCQSPQTKLYVPKKGGRVNEIKHKTSNPDPGEMLSIRSCKQLGAGGSRL
jgi:hypothetical protein